MISNIHLYIKFPHRVSPFTAAESVSLYALLLAPDVHDGVHRQELDPTHLTAHRVTENGDAFFLLEILHGLRRHLIGAVPLVHIADVFIMMRDLLELGLDPAGADAHDMDALRAQLAAERA